MSDQLVPNETSLTGRRVKLNGGPWVNVEQDTLTGYIKVRGGLRSSGKWEAKGAVTHVDPPILPPAGAAKP